MCNHNQHTSFSGHKSRVYFICIAFAFVLLACNNRSADHGAHSGGTADHATMKDSSGMKMSGVKDSSNAHAAHGSMAGMDMPGEQASTDTIADETYWNTLPTNRTVISTQQAIEPLDQPANFTVHGNGYIDFDYRRNRKVPVRVGGRIERLYVKYNYQYVRKGEKILELYSPDISTYIEELLYLQKSSGDSILAGRARQKLLLLGLTSSQVKQIEKSGEAPYTIAIYSPFEGFVLFDPSAPSAMAGGAGNDAGMGGGMAGGTGSSAVSPATRLSDNSIREGMYVSKDQTLFWINDFREAWGIVAFTKENEKYIRKGQPLSVTSELMPEKTFTTPVQFLELVYQRGQKFSQARVYLPNTSGILKQNSLITATASVTASSLTVPAGSVFYLGKVAIVWVRAGVTKDGSNIFQSRVVRIGHRDHERVEILQGLQKGEWIARDAAYLADGETIIKY
ncbi:MAG: efflux RND transporter periplasmic adaptor subunit [Chitinophagaceae bacterium]|nr:efflux RND transporter periplasmic adaptor subunit [Chitinophagaceae bacterium]